ncbi:MAG TPA: hypothetical protein VIF83_16065 [Gemmatimonadaceae bacterium]|jgi:hypothetical protein
MSRLLATVAVAASQFFPLAGFGQTATCHKLLIPIPLGDYAGANASVWRNELWIRNDADHPVRIYRRAWQPIPDSRGFRIVDVPDTPVPALTTLEVEPLPGRESFVTSEYIYVDDASAEQVYLQARTHDASRNQTSAGTNIPVIPTTAGRMRQQLLNVPIDDRYRYALRVYTFDAVANIPIKPENRIRIFDLASDALLVDEPLLFNGFENEGTCPGLPYPYPNVLTNVRFDRPELAGRLVRIEVVSNLYFFWAMLSLTNNTTNEVTIITP